MSTLVVRRWGSHWLADFFTTVRLAALLHWMHKWGLHAKHADDRFWWDLTIVIAIAVVTDYLDGLCARKLGSNWWGLYYDGAVDKVCLLTFIYVIWRHHPFGNAWFEIGCMLIMTIRECVFLLGWAFGGPPLFPVTKSGKVKMAVQFIALLLYSIPAPFVGDAGRVALAVACAATLWSLWEYIQAWWREGSKI